MNRTRCFMALAMAAAAAEAPRAHGATKAELTREASRIVEQTLRGEAEGAIDDRRPPLEEAIERVPDHPAAHWQSGFLYDARRKEWLPVEQVAQAASQDERLEQYQNRRQACPDTIAGQLALARWCLDEGLPDQARAHLARVLEMNPNHLEARRLLGYRRINGQWVEGRELARAAQEERQAQADARKWSHELEKIRRGLESRSRSLREGASKKLMAIQDPSVVAGVERLLCGRGGPAALAGVEKLKNMPLYQAAEALAWQAVFSPWAPVRQAAAVALQSHRKHDYVPLLLSAMDTPIKSRVQIYESLDGRLLYRHALYHEGRDRRDLAIVDTPYRHLSGFVVQTVQVGDRRYAQQAEALHPANRQALSEHEYVMNAFRQDAMLKAMQREQTLARHNRGVNEMNARLCAVLRTSLQQSDLTSPQQCWNWWYDYNERYRSPCKPTQMYYRRAKQESVTSPVAVYRFKTLSCLAPDTPIWTETGPRPISEIRAGDRVLASDVETGRLALKPVLKKTIRPETQLLRITTADGRSVEATGGHDFWVAGRGWMLARDLAPGMRLHTVTGVTAVQSVAAAGIQRPHNLVVADYHTYFVGEDRALTHDNTMRGRTNAVVPGLTALAAASRP